MPTSNVYQTSQFAKKAMVTVRTLRYYDRVGLLSPSLHTEAGYRLYTDADFFRLQQILALKFLGFSLEEIKACLQICPSELQETLAFQKAMMQEKRRQLDIILQALDETEKLVQGDSQDWNAIVRMIQVLQAQQSNDWRKKYFTDEQLRQMEELSKRHYSEEQRQKLAEWGKHYSEEDQRRATLLWDALISELKQHVAAGTDPTSPEAQDFAGRWLSLLNEFTHGDPGIEQSLKSLYKELIETPPEQRLYPLSTNSEEMAFVAKAIEIYRS